MKIYPATTQQWVEVTDVTPFTTVFGPEWRTQPAPSPLDVRWRAVFGYSTLASRIINYLVSLSQQEHHATLGALLDAVARAYAAAGRFGPGIGLLGTAYLLVALELAPPAAPADRPPHPRTIREMAARQLRVIAISLREAVTPDSLAALQQIQRTLEPLCVAAYPTLDDRAGDAA